MRTNAILTIPGTTIRLGDLVRSTINGFEGIVVSHSRHITGCDTLGVEAECKTTDDGKTNVPFRWMDVMAVKVIKKNFVDAQPIAKDIPAAG